MTRALLCWLAMCALAIAVGLSSFWLPAPRPADAPLSEFSAGRAIEIDRAIAQAPHPAGSDENRRVREYLLGQMRDLGLNPRTIEGKLAGTPVVDLYGVLPGTQSTKADVLLVAHYDSVHTGPGASDDGAGVATILETIRALKATGEISNTIGVLFTDGEERGLLGASVFVRAETNLVHNVQLVINLEARGNHGPVGMFQTGPDNGNLIRVFSAICPMPIAMSFSADVAARMPNDSDFSVFRKAGKSGYNFAYIGGIQYYHSKRDTPENVSLRTLQHYGDCVFSLTKHFAHVPAYAISNLAKENATFFPLGHGVLVNYSTGDSEALAFITTVLFVCVMAKRVFSSAIRARYLAESFGVALLSMITVAAIGLGGVVVLVTIFKAKHYGPFIIGVPAENWVVIACLLGTGVITMAIRAVLLRRANFAERLAGPIVIWVLLMLVLLFRFPNATYLFMWPALLGIIALLASEASPDNRLKRPIVTILTAAPAALIWAPTFVLLHEAITIGLLPFSLALTALALSFAPIPQPKINVSDRETESPNQ